MAVSFLLNAHRVFHRYPALSVKKICFTSTSKKVRDADFWAGGTVELYFIQSSLIAETVPEDKPFWRATLTFTTHFTFGLVFHLGIDWIMKHESSRMMPDCVLPITLHGMWKIMTHPVCHCLAKQTAPPQTPVIGWASVTVLSLWKRSVLNCIECALVVEFKS